MRPGAFVDKVMQFYTLGIIDMSGPQSAERRLLLCICIGIELKGVREQLWGDRESKAHEYIRKYAPPPLLRTCRDLSIILREAL